MGKYVRAQTLLYFFPKETRSEIHKPILVILIRRDRSEEDKQLGLNKVPGRTSESWKQDDSATSL